jgi:hypothetical protein
MDRCVPRALPHAELEIGVGRRTSLLPNPDFIYFISGNRKSDMEAKRRG